MKSSKLSDEKRKERLERLFWKRADARTAHRKHGRSFLKSKTMRKVFRVGKFTGKVTVAREYGPYPHSSTRQRARYARQIAAGQIGG